MADRRPPLHGAFLVRTICDSGDVAELIEHFGGFPKEGAWAGLLWDRLLTHMDHDYRQEGDPVVIRGRCFPHHEVPPARVDAYLKEMERRGMIVRYTVGRVRYVYVPNGQRYQPRRRADRYRPSKCPPPPGAAGEAQPKSAKKEPRSHGAKARQRPARGKGGRPRPATASELGRGGQTRL